MILNGSPPSVVGQLLVDDLDDLLGRRQALGELRSGAAGLDPLDEVPDDLERDVGLEQGDPDLAEDLVDLGVAETTAAREGA